MRLHWVIAVVAICLLVAVAAAYAAGKTSVPEVTRAQRSEVVV